MKRMLKKNEQEENEMEEGTEEEHDGGRNEGRTRRLGRMRNDEENAKIEEERTKRRIFEVEKEEERTTVGRTR